jgi:hypothetical protein
LHRLNSSSDGSGGGGIPFEDFIAHFVLGTDEACLVASPNGTAKVLGKKSKELVAREPQKAGAAQAQ